MRCCVPSAHHHFLPVTMLALAGLLGLPFAVHAQTGVLELRASGLILDAHRPDVNENGCKIQLWTRANRATNQQWVLVALGDGWHKIENRASGRVLDAHSP